MAQSIVVGNCLAKAAVLYFSTKNMKESKAKREDIPLHEKSGYSSVNSNGTVHSGEFIRGKGIVIDRYSYNTAVAL